VGYDPCDRWEGPKPRLNGVIVSEPRYFCRACRHQIAGQPFYVPGKGPVCVRCGKGAGNGDCCADCGSPALGLTRAGDGKQVCSPCLILRKQEYEAMTIEEPY
jgi:hypothetical protein